MSLLYSLRTICPSGTGATTNSTQVALALSPSMKGEKPMSKPPHMIPDIISHSASTKSLWNALRTITSCNGTDFLWAFDVGITYLYVFCCIIDFMINVQHTTKLQQIQYIHFKNLVPLSHQQDVTSTRLQSSLHRSPFMSPSYHNSFLLPYSFFFMLKQFLHPLSPFKLSLSLFHGFLLFLLH
jgi:hypothetical protein